MKSVSKVKSCAPLPKSKFGNQSQKNICLKPDKLTQDFLLNKSGFSLIALLYSKEEETYFNRICL